MVSINQLDQPTGRRYQGCEVDQALDVALDPFWIKPADFLVCLPEFGRLVNVNLASLLSICLSELLLNSQCVDTCPEDSALRRQVSCAIEAKVRSKKDLVRVEKVAMRVVTKIDGSSAPVNFERVGLVRQAIERWREIIEELEVFVLARNSDNLARLGSGSWGLWLRLSDRILDDSSWSGLGGRSLATTSRRSEDRVSSDSGSQCLIL